MNQPIFGPRKKSVEDLQEELERAEKLIEQLRNKLQSPFGKPTIKTQVGHKITKGMALIRRPLFSASLNDHGWPARMINALTAGKTLGFTIFELDLSEVPAYKDSEDLLSEKKEVIQEITPVGHGEYAPIIGFHQAQELLGLLGGKSPLKTTIYINVWALIVGGKER